MANRRLSSILEDMELLDPRQHAFRKGKGTGSYFCELDDKLENVINDNHHCELALLDLAKAYDRTWTRNILTNLNTWGIEGHLFNFIQHFLSDRKFKVLIGRETSGLRIQENGVPQGSVLSVTLFLVAMQTIFANIPSNVDALIYADDILLISKGPFQASVRKKLQIAVDSVVDWAHSVGFSISAEKSQLIHCCRIKRHRGHIKSLTTNNTKVKQVTCARILGFYLDNKINFKRHINHLRKSATKRLRIVKAIGGRSKV